MTRRRRGLLLAALALVLGGLAASDVGRREDALAQRLAPLVDVVVARDDLPAGSAIRAGALGVREVPARWAPVGAAHSPAEVAGATPATGIPAGAYVTGAALAAPAAPASVRRGERAVEVLAAGSPDLIVAGARVDVLVTREHRGTVLALQDVEVIATQDPPEGAQVDATLRVGLRDAVYLTAAQSFAREIRLLPRAAGDRSRAIGVRVGEGLR